jgi:hypothetical protein
MLVSPAISAFGAMSYIPGLGTPSFAQNLAVALKDGRDIWMVYGTEDNFTSIEVYTKLVGRAEEGTGRIEGREVKGAGHFYRGEGDGDGLIRCFREWLGGREG